MLLILKRSLNRILFIGIILINSDASAFPYFQNRGYNNCLTCHVSPTGSGPLSEYGHAVRPEINSIFNPYEVPQWGLSSKTTAITFGAQLKLLQLQKKTKYTKIQKLIPMQAEGNLTVTHKSTALTASIGMNGSRNHYLVIDPIKHMTLRIGKFLPRYGVGFNDHTLATRKQYGFVENSERYSFELTGTVKPFWVNAVVTEREEAILNFNVSLYKQKQGVSWLLTKEKTIHPAIWGVYTLGPFIGMYQINLCEPITWDAKLLLRVINGAYLYAVNWGGGIELFPIPGLGINLELRDTGQALALVQILL